MRAKENSLGVNLGERREYEYAKRGSRCKRRKNGEKSIQKIAL